MKTLLICWALLISQAFLQPETRPISDHDRFEYARREIKGLHSYAPKNGLVPDEETAVGIAFAISAPVYGKKQMEDEKPLHAELAGGVWTVLGTLKGSGPGSGIVGGTLIMQIRQTDGKILYFGHDQ